MKQIIANVTAYLIANHFILSIRNFQGRKCRKWLAINSCDHLLYHFIVSISGENPGLLCGTRYLPAIMSAPPSEQISLLSHIADETTSEQGKDEKVSI